MPMFSTHSRSGNVLRSIGFGFGFFFLGSVSDVWLQQHAHPLSTAILTDALLGLAAGLLVLIYEERQQKIILRKLEVIRLMNHHVRNSLQVISYAGSTPQQEELADEVQSAVERIEWALRDVLPGQREDIKSLIFHSQSQPAAKRYQSRVASL